MSYSVISICDSDTTRRPSRALLVVRLMVVILLLTPSNKVLAQLHVYNSEEEIPHLMKARGLWIEGSIGAASCRTSYDVSSTEYEAAVHFHPLSFPVIGLRSLSCTSSGAPYQADLSFDFNISHFSSCIVLLGVGCGYYRREFDDGYPTYNHITLETWTIPMNLRFLFPINNSLLFSTQLSASVNPKEVMAFLNVGFWVGSSVRE